MRKLAWIAATSTVVALIAVLGAHLLGGQGTSAQGTVNFDIDPEITGNDANHLGTVEACYAVACPSANCTWNGSATFDDVSDYIIDIVVTGDTQAPAAYDAALLYDQNIVHVADPGTDQLIKLPGASSFNPDSDSDGEFNAGAIYFTGAGTAGSGTIVRVGLDIGGSGLVTFTLGPAPGTAYKGANPSPPPPALDHPITVDGGVLAINTACPSIDTIDTIGVYRHDGVGDSMWFLRNTNSEGTADLTFDYATGINDGVPVAGDWNDDDIDTIGIYRPSEGLWHLRNSNDSGVADNTFTYGAGISGAVPVVGDWNGDGTDSIGIYVPATGLWHLRNANSEGVAENTFNYGAGISGAVPVVGDWNGDGTDTIGIYQPSSGFWFLRNANSEGVADISVFSFGTGITGGLPVAGDWNGNGTDTIGLYIPSTGLWHLRNTNSEGTADLTFSYGAGITTGKPVAGDWNGS